MDRASKLSVLWVMFVIALLAASTRAEPPAATVPFTPHPLSRIEPGTVIVDRAPAGWSQLVVKSHPKVMRGDVSQVAPSTIEMANLFFNSTLIKVGKRDVGGQPRYDLQRVAIGIGTRIDGKDTIISSATAGDLGAKLSWVAGMVLGGSEEHLTRVVEVARSLTMAIVDAPATWVRDGKHVPAALRYAIMVDPRDGRCYTLTWLLYKLDETYGLADGPLVLMSPSLVTVCDMHVDVGKFTLGVPSADAFAVTQLPPGVKLAMPERARALAAANRFTAAETHQIEVALWTAIFPDPNSAAIAPR